MVFGHFVAKCPNRPKESVVNNHKASANTIRLISDGKLKSLEEASEKSKIVAKNYA